MTDFILDHAVRTWFTPVGLRAAIVIAPNGSGNGYVQLNDGHPDLGRGKNGYWDMDDVPVHFGLTYGVDDRGWVGFDTMHAGDYWPPEERAKLAETPPRVKHEPLDPAARALIDLVGILERDADPGDYGRIWTVDDLVAEVTLLAEALHYRAVGATFAAPKELE